MHDQRLYTTELLSRRWITEETFVIELTRPLSFQFTAGQRIRFFHQNTERDYSLITQPAASPLALLVSKVAGGQFSPMLASAAIGTRFAITGPHGYFTYRPSTRPAVFVATGTGIAPFLSMVRSGITGFTLLHGVRSINELYYEIPFRRAALSYVPCLSTAPSEFGKPGTGVSGRVTQYLEEHLPPGNYRFYLCGGQEMIRDVIYLIDERFPGSLVYTEIFY